MPAEFARHRTLLLCLGLVITLTLPLKAAAQEAERVVEKTSRRPTPLKIRVVKTKKGEVMLGKKFVDSDEDWFKGLSIVLENVSDKTVTYVGVGLLFPRQPGDEGKPPPVLGFALRRTSRSARVGRRQDAAASTKARRRNRRHAARSRLL